MRLFELIGFAGRSARVAEVITTRDLEAITLARRTYGNSDLLNKYRDNPNLIITKNPNLMLDDFLAMRRVHDDDILGSMKLLDEELAAKQGAATAKDSTAAIEADKTSKLRIILDGTIASGATYCGLAKCYGHALRAALDNEKRKRVEEPKPTEETVGDVFALK